MFVLLWTCTEMHFWHEICLKPRFKMSCSGVSLHPKTNALKRDSCVFTSGDKPLWATSAARNITYDVCRNSLIIMRSHIQKTQPSQTSLIELKRGILHICKSCLLAGWKRWKVMRAKPQNVFKVKSAHIFKHLRSSLRLVQCIDLHDVWRCSEPRSRYPLTQVRACLSAYEKRPLLSHLSIHFWYSNELAGCNFMSLLCHFL